ncbi:TIGR04104 family putative zinc finger protein [Lentibacillus salicampi]|uniref:Cxxc_20_cxxc protein n=1 Tax=Lentibacillus salicampi TaxID=175306 RepID=A0A4Y9AH24_9BACI|nr:TIGR04104 family putative zinc finger protein [Lentibacillus salicampi]TFJ94397.1 hypothetical protein E4U82_00325 [Lentibacillus salicampi]
MPTCQSCHKKWTWKQTMKAMSILDIRLTCPYCGNKQYLTAKARKKTNIVNFVIPLAILPGPVFDLAPLASIGIFIGAAMLVVVINPYLTELSNEEAPYWTINS